MSHKFLKLLPITLLSISTFFLIFSLKVNATDLSTALASNNLNIGATESSTIYQFKVPIPASVSTGNTIAGGNNPYSFLKIPTQVTQIGSTYFIVDCYNNQVIYSNSLDLPLPQWKVMTKSAKQPHTIASDGSVYLVDDTENNRILIFEKRNNSFVQTQTFNSIGIRPHYILYDATSASFFAWSSSTGDMYIFKRDPNSTQVYLSEIRRVNELFGVYVRSFTIIGDEIFFPSGNNSYITRVNKKDFSVIGRYPVPSSIAGMIQITKINDYYYCTVSTDLNGSQKSACILRTTDLNSLASNQYENLNSLFGRSDGTHYYISQIGNNYYMTHHRTLPGIWAFTVDANNKITKTWSLH